jgi:hypothetical protein
MIAEAKCKCHICESDYHNTSEHTDKIMFKESEIIRKSRLYEKIRILHIIADCFPLSYSQRIDLIREITSTELLKSTNEKQISSKKKRGKTVRWNIDYERINSKKKEEEKE